MPGISVRVGGLAVVGVLALGLASPISPFTPTAASAASAETPAPGTVTTPEHVLTRGMHGRDVLRLQRKLAIVPANGYFDKRTQVRLKAVQKWAGERATGVADHRGWRATNKWAADRAHRINAANARARHLINLANARARKAAGSAGARAAKVLHVAWQYRGRPYAWGATGPRAFDCSGYTRFVFNKALHKHLPRTAAEQAGAVKRISRSKARPGDLVFFTHGGSVYHVGIYAGGNSLWHASRPGTPSGKGPIFSSSVFFGRAV